MTREDSFADGHWQTLEAAVQRGALSKLHVQSNTI
jgi:hypothetical protein